MVSYPWQLCPNSFFFSWLQIHEGFCCTQITSCPAAKWPSSLWSRARTLCGTAVSAWASAGVVGALGGSSQRQVLRCLQKPQWVELELCSSHIKLHSVAPQLPSWPQLLICLVHLSALTSPSTPVSVTYPWRKVPNPVKPFPQLHCSRCSQSMLNWTWSIC